LIKINASHRRHCQDLSMLMENDQESFVDNAEQSAAILSNRQQQVCSGPIADSRLRRCGFRFGSFRHLKEEDDNGHQSGGA
jgi:hypothetical protein